MLTLPPSVRVYVAANTTDLRKSFDGLSAQVVQHFGADPLCGHLFVFLSGVPVRCGVQDGGLRWGALSYHGNRGGCRRRPEPT